MKNRILVLNSDLSGLNKYLIQHLSRKGWDCISVDIPDYKIYKGLALILSFSPNIRVWRNRASAYLDRLHKTSNAFLKKTEFCQEKVEKLKNKIDIILQFSGMFMPVRDLSALNGTPYVIFTDYTMKLAENYPTWGPFRAQREKWFALERKLYENASLILTSSDNAKRSFIGSYSIENKRVATVGCGVTLQDSTNLTKEYKDKTVLFIGRSFTSKGGHILLEAFKKVREKIRDAKLVIVGPAKAKLRISALGVTFLGRVNNREQIKNLYKQASIFAMPSLREPFGLVFLEAMSYKLPCIGTKVDAMPEIIEDGKTGFLVPPGDCEALAEKILLLLESPDLMREMGDVGFLRAKEKFSWENIINKIDLNLRAVLEKRID